MINTIHGDLLSANGIILHQVNCRGVMGSGVARAIREKWPDAYKAYRDHWSMRGGSPYANTLLGEVAFSTHDEAVVGHCFAQDKYGRDGRRYTSYDALDLCMKEVAKFHYHHQYMPINFPLIGCGTGGGQWSVVREIIEYHLPEPIVKNLWLL